MHLNDYQDKATEVSTHPLGGPRTCLEYGSLALCGEAGELANLIKKHWRDAEVTGTAVTLEQRDQIIDELGDVLWYVAFVATVLGVDLANVAYVNIAKLVERKEKGK